MAVLGGGRGRGIGYVGVAESVAMDLESTALERCRSQPSGTTTDLESVAVNWVGLALHWIRNPWRGGSPADPAGFTPGRFRAPI